MEPIVTGPSKAEKSTQRVILKLTQVSPAHPDGRLTDRTRCVQLDASRPSVLLGRASKNRSLTAAKDNLWIESPIITKEHARFLMGENAEQPVILRDLNSTHGTWIGNQSIRQDYPIYDGDIVRFGTEIQTGPQIHKPHTFIIEAQWQNMSRPVTPAVPAPTAEISRFSVPDMTDDEDSVVSESDLTGTRLTGTETVRHQRIDSTASAHSRQSSVSRSYEVPYSDDDEDEDDDDDDDGAEDEDEEELDEGEEEVFVCEDEETEEEATNHTANCGNAGASGMTNYIELDGDEDEQDSGAHPQAVISNASVAAPSQQEAVGDDMIPKFTIAPPISAPLQCFYPVHLFPTTRSTIAEDPVMSNETNQFASDKYDEDQDVQEITKSAFIASKHVADGVKSYWEGTDAHDNGKSPLSNSFGGLKEVLKSNAAWQEEDAPAMANTVAVHPPGTQAASMRAAPEPPGSHERSRTVYEFGSLDSVVPKPTDDAMHSSCSYAFDPRSTDAVMVKRLGRAENPVWPQAVPASASNVNFTSSFSDDILTFECFHTKPAAAPLPSINVCAGGYKDGPFARREPVAQAPAPQQRLSTRLSIDNIINKDHGELKRKANDAGLDDLPAVAPASQASNASYGVRTSNQSFDAASTRAQPASSEAHSEIIITKAPNSELPAGDLGSSPEPEEQMPRYSLDRVEAPMAQWAAYPSSSHHPHTNANPVDPLPNSLDYLSEEQQTTESEEDDIVDPLFFSKTTDHIRSHPLEGDAAHNDSLPSAAVTQEEIIQPDASDESQDEQDTNGKLVEAAVQQIALNLKEPLTPADSLTTVTVEDNAAPVEKSDTLAHATTQEEGTAQQPPQKKRKVGEHVVSRRQRGGRRGVRRFMGKLIPFMAGAAATATAIFGAAGVLISTMPDEIQRQARLEMGG